MRTRISILSVLVLVVTVVPLVPVAATTGTLIIGRSMTLIEDQYGPIEVIASDVTLDCDGYALIGSPADYGILINGLSNVTVRNCVITGFDQGIRALNSTGLLIADNTLYDNVGDGIHIAFVEGSVVTRNLSNDNDRNGLWAAWTEDLHVSGNTFHRNLINGFALHSSGAVLVERNLAFDNTDFGFKLRQTVDSSFLRNRADRNGEGFHLGEVDSSLFFKNKAMDNTEDGFNVWGAFNANSGNTFVKNQALENGRYGFEDDLEVVNGYDHNVCSENGDGGSDPVGLCLGG